MATSGLSNDNFPLPRLRPRESGQLSTIIPQNHGITISKLYYRASKAIPTLGCSIEISRDIYIFITQARETDQSNWSVGVNIY